MLIALIGARASTSQVKRAEESARAASDRAVAIFNNAEVVQAMGMRPNLRRRWEIDRLDSLSWQALANDNTGIFTNLSRTVRTIMGILVYGIVAALIINREVTAGVMIAAAIINAQALRPVDQLIGQWKHLVNSYDAMQKLQELFRTYPVDYAPHALLKPQGRITFEDVNISAPMAPESLERPRLILRSVNFDIPAGKTLAVIGPSASGKTSILKCILGLWKPLYGEVRVDGAELDHWNENELGRHLGYLPQDVGLFAGSVSENISRFDPAADVDQVQKAAHLARVNEMILMLPKGYNTVLRDGGSGLSGGQKQRVGLARAVFGEPAIVILDEPNSALDAEGESQLIATIMDLKGMGATVVFVTHKANLLTVADYILVLGEGTVQKFGTREEVQLQLRGNRVVQLQGQPGGAA